MNTVMIAPGCHMPWLGFGTWKIEHEVPAAVLTAIHSGYTHIDCAPIYGNEADIGAVLPGILNATPGMRDRLWLTSKLWNAEHHPDRVRNACVQTLDDLQVNHLDLYLMHWPVAFRSGIRWPESPQDIIDPRHDRLQDTWAAMEALVDEGLVRSIGVSNFSILHLQTILAHARIRPAVNQIECHPYLPQQELTAWCTGQGIHVTAYSPLGSADRPPTLKHDRERAVLEDPVVREVAQSHAATPAQVLLAWHRHQGRSAVCKSTSRLRLLENMAASRLELSAADMELLRAIATRQRYVNPAPWFMSGSPLSELELWRNEAAASSQDRARA